jgi:hypothetical protein
VVLGLAGLLTLFAAFLVVFILSGISSWFDYRLEEKRVFDNAVGQGYRRGPSLKNIYRCHEVYLLLVMILGTILIDWFVVTKIVPSIQQDYWRSS